MNYELPSNPYPDDAGIIDLMRAFFTPIWDGLSNINVPGFGFTFAQFFIAILTAGLIGLILKTAFFYFGSHLVDGGLKRGAKKDKGSGGRKSQGRYKHEKKEK